MNLCRWWPADAHPADHSRWWPAGAVPDQLWYNPRFGLCGARSTLPRTPISSTVLPRTSSRSSHNQHSLRNATCSSVIISLGSPARETNGDDVHVPCGSVLPTASLVATSVAAPATFPIALFTQLSNSVWVSRPHITAPYSMKFHRPRPRVHPISIALAIADKPWWPVRLSSLSFSTFKRWSDLVVAKICSEGKLVREEDGIDLSMDAIQLASLLGLELGSLQMLLSRMDEEAIVSCDVANIYLSPSYIDLDPARYVTGFLNA